MEPDRLHPPSLPADDERAVPAPPRRPATADALNAGASLDLFVIERVLHSGGFGVVYLATDRAGQEQVAISEYLPVPLAVRGDGGQVALRSVAHQAAFARGLQAFMEESERLARCEHPSLPKVIQAWRGNGTAYRVMQYYPGVSLRSVRDAMDEPPDEAALRPLLDSLLGALETLHDAGGVHRGLSPENILLDEEDRPVLLGFGAARRAVMGDKVQALMSLIEPMFVPAEQLGEAPGTTPGPWTDLYAWGAVARYCIDSRSFAGGPLAGPDDSLRAVVTRLQTRFPRLRYSEPLLEAIEWALEPRPEDRPQSVAHLRMVLDGAPGAARPPPPVRVHHAAAAAKQAAAAAAASVTIAPLKPVPAEPVPALPAEPVVSAATPTAASPPPASPAPVVAHASPSPARPWAAGVAPASMPRSDPPSVPLGGPRDDDRAARVTRTASGGVRISIDAPPPEDDPLLMTPDPADSPFRRQPRRPLGEKLALGGVIAALLLAIGVGSWKLNEQRDLQQAMGRLAGEARAGLSGPASPAADPATASSAGPARPAAAPEDVGETPLAVAPTTLPRGTAAPGGPTVAAAPRSANRGSESLPITQAPLATGMQPPPESAVAAAAPAAPAEPATPPTPTPSPAPAPTAPPAAAAPAPAAAPVAIPAPAPAIAPAVVAPAAPALAEPPVAAAGTSSSGTVANPPPSVVQPSVPREPPQRLPPATTAREGPTREAGSPRAVCAPRSEFALYRCMQALCAKPQWTRHAQCVRMRERDEIVQMFRTSGGATDARVRPQWWPDAPGVEHADSRNRPLG